MEIEIWKSIKGYEGHYDISSNGRVRSFKHGVNILVINWKPNGYGFISLSLNGNLKYYHIHRLVAHAFIPNPENKPQVNHKDCNKSNNNLSNLEWMTGKENCLHALQNIVYKRNPIKGFGSEMMSLGVR